MLPPIGMCYCYMHVSEAFFLLTSSILSFLQARPEHTFVPRRKTGALCAMKEAEVFSDDPKSAECIRQLEQVANLFSYLLTV